MDNFGAMTLDESDAIYHNLIENAVNAFYSMGVEIDTLKNQRDHLCAQLQYGAQINQYAQNQINQMAYQFSQMEDMINKAYQLGKMEMWKLQNARKQPTPPSLPKDVKRIGESEIKDVKYDIVAQESDRKDKDTQGQAYKSETQSMQSDADILNTHHIGGHENAAHNGPPPEGNGATIMSRKAKILRKKGTTMEILKIELTDSAFDEHLNVFNSSENIGWKKVDYDKDGSSLVRLEVTEGVYEVDEKTKVALESAIDRIEGDAEGAFITVSNYDTPVFKHKVSGNTDGDGVVWEAFDMMLHQYWKEAAAKGLGGLTDGKMCVVRLLGGNDETGKVNYMSLYMKGDSLSRAMDSNPEYKSKGIFYDKSLRKSPEYSAIFACFDYCHKLNGNKSFAIVEQVADNRDTDKGIILSRYMPRTELRNEFNIFKGAKRPSIVANLQTRFFICKKDEAGNFIIKIPVFKN